MTKEENEKRIERLKNIVLNMPDKPGSYQFYDAEHTIIYVGKAKRLKQRVSSYFHKEVDRFKTKVLVSKIEDISYTVVNTEEDALLLENSLIKKYNPRYNVLLRDDVQQALLAPDVIALRGDWSRPSADISQFLTARGSAAVPFNQIYGPELPQGQILPALLDREHLLATLSAAKGK